MEETAKGTGGRLWTVLGRFWAKRCKGQVAPFQPIPCNRFPKQLPVPLYINKRLYGRFWHQNSLGKLCPDREKERPAAKGLAVRDKTGEDGYKAEGKRKGEGGGARRPHA